MSSCVSNSLARARDEFCRGRPSQRQALMGKEAFDISLEMILGGFELQNVSMTSRQPEDALLSEHPEMVMHRRNFAVAMVAS